MSFAADTGRATFQNALYDVLKICVGWFVGSVVMPIMTDTAIGLNVPGAVAWGTVATLMLVGVGAVAFEFWRTRNALPRRRVRLLEYHATHLMWVRRTLLDEATDDRQIADAPRVIDKHRRLLLDLIPSVFPTSAHQEFSVPAFFRMSADVAAQVNGMREADRRVKIIADADSLLVGIYKQWLANGGIVAPRP